MLLIRNYRGLAVELLPRTGRQSFIFLANEKTLVKYEEKNKNNTSPPKLNLCLKSLLKLFYHSTQYVSGIKIGLNSELTKYCLPERFLQKKKNAFRRLDCN